MGGYVAVLSRLLPFDTLRAFNLESADSIVELHHRLPKEDWYRGSHVEVCGGSKARHLDINYLRTYYTPGLCCPLGRPWRQKRIERMKCGQMDVD